MDILTANIKVVCDELKSFIKELYDNAKIDEERNEIKAMIALMYQMYVKNVA